MSARTPALSEENFAATTTSGIVFVDFWADWCGPCKAFAPIYEQAAEKHPDVVFAKVDTEEQEALGEQFSIQSIPTLLAFRDGLLVLRKEGAMGLASLEALVVQVKNLELALFKKFKAAEELTRKGQRPPGVPKTARYSENDDEWVVGAVDDEGAEHGPYQFFKANGALCNEVTFEHGTPTGPFKRFHETGEISQTGQFENGVLTGVQIWTASERYTTERMHEGGISPKVWRTEMEHQDGKVVSIRHFLKDGTRCVPTTGEPYPKLPAGLPDDATFREDLNQWVHGGIDENRERHGLWKFWTPEGAFHSEMQFEHGAKTGLYKAVTVGEYSDARIHIEQGEFEADQAIGTWRLLDDGGEILHQRELGAPQTDEAFESSVVFDDARKPAQEWKAHVRTCLDQAHHGEGLLALARACVAAREIKPFIAALGRFSLPLNEETANAMADAVVENAGESWAQVANGLLRGADPAAVLRHCAVRCDQTGRPLAALDFVNAAILLSPDRPHYLFTRALVLISLGLDAEAARDIEALQPHSPDEAKFLTSYLRALFLPFDTWPTKETPKSSYDDLPEKPAQKPDAVKLTVQKYATRLSLIREAMLARFNDGADFGWIPPAMDSLLPNGPVELGQQTLERDGEEIVVDETLDAGALELPDLLRAARADYSALTWLLWSCGVNSLQMPSKVAAPKTFGQAAGMAMQRLWRARDKRLTQGEGAKEAEVPGFSFAGVDIDELHPNVAGIAEQQYAETQAMFHWLSDKTNVSPWQDNLRGS